MKVRATIEADARIYVGDRFIGTAADLIARQRGGNPAGKRWTNEAWMHLRAATVLRCHLGRWDHRTRRELAAALRVIVKHARNIDVRVEAMLLYDHVNPDGLP